MLAFVHPPHRFYIAGRCLKHLEILHSSVNIFHMKATALKEMAEAVERAAAPPVLPKDQLQLAADLRHEKKRPTPKAKGDYQMKVHKRKGKDRVWHTYAIVDCQTSKQVIQLTESAHENASTIVNDLVAGLNDGSVSKQEAVNSINALKNQMR